MKSEWKVPEEWDGKLLKKFARNYCGLSSALWKKIKWTGIIKLNCNNIKNANTVIHANDIFECEWSEETDIIPSDISLNVVYEDEWILIIDKEPKMLIHPTSKNEVGTLVNAIAGYYKKTNQKEGIHPIYRLDRNTSGLIVVAKSAKVQYELSKSHDLIKREYLAIVKGIFDIKEGSIVQPIGRKDGSIIEWIVRKDGKYAKTDYKVIEECANFSLLKLRLHTGRTHQIRVHMNFLGHSLIGDDLYGGDCSILKRQALHSYKVSFIHLETKENMEFISSLPLDMKEFFEIRKVDKNEIK